MKLIAFLVGLLPIFSSFCQNLEPIPVTTQSLNIPGAFEVGNWLNEHPNQSYPNYPKIYYGFAAGDEIIIDFATDNKKGTQEIAVTEFESKSIVYSNRQFQTLDGVRIKVPKTAVYKFEFATNHVFDRQCRISIRRIPAADSTRNFNCNITWKTISDTTFTIVDEKRKVGSKYQPVALQTPIHYYVNSGSNAHFKGGKSRIALPIILPENTVTWYYTFSATRNQNSVEATKAGMKLFGQLSKLIDETGVLSFGINTLTQPPGADYCDIYLLDQYNWQAFLNKEDEKWRYYTEGSRQNIVSGIVNVKSCCTSNTFYLGIKNPDATYGVAVMIEIVAIIEKATYEIVKVKKPVSVTTKKMPVFGI